MNERTLGGPSEGRPTGDVGSERGKQSMGERLDDYLRENKLSQAELARMSGVKQQTISYLIKQNATGSSYAIKLATALGVNPAWLQEGLGTPHGPTVGVGSAGVSALRAHWIPRLKMNEIEAYLAGSEPAKSVEHIVTSAGSDRAFCMTVSGRSMAPEFVEGDDVVVEPGLRPEPGDYVISLVDEAYLLRRFKLTNQAEGSFELVPVNADFPLIRSDQTQARVVGTVVEHRRQMRRNPN